MKLWLSRQRNGTYMVSLLRPEKATVLGTEYEDLYFQPGEPIGLRHLCAAGVKRVFDVELEPLASVRIMWPRGWVIDDES